MSTVTIGVVAGHRPPPARMGMRQPRLVVGALADGTPYYAPMGEVVADGDLVVCHLCGRVLRSVAAHLRVHGWTKQAYCAAFGLERGQALEGAQTRKLRAAAFVPRLVFDPAIREGSAAGRERARTGQLARDAAAAARGRHHPEQRRRKARQARAAIPADVVARANTERGRRHRVQVAAEAAGRQGYPDIGALVLARLAAGASLAAVSREAGLHKDWLSRHLADLDPVAAAAAARALPARPDARWLPAVTRLGFADVAGYLAHRHVTQHRTVNAIATEVGLSHHAVAAALRRHGLARTVHAAKRHEAGQRAAGVAASLGFGDIAGYLSDRRGAGWTWRAISAESGQPESWLRRHARAHAAAAPGSGAER